MIIRCASTSVQYNLNTRSACKFAQIHKLEKQVAVTSRCHAAIPILAQFNGAVYPIDCRDW